MVEHNLYVAVVDVDRREYLVQLCGEAFSFENLVQSLAAKDFLADSAVGGIAAILLVAQHFAQRETKARIRRLGVVDILLHERILIPKAGAVEVGVKVVQGQCYLAVLASLIGVIGLHSVFPFVLYHVACQLHGGIVAAAIAFAFLFLGGDFHLGQLGGRWTHLHVESGMGAILYRLDLGSVSHHFEYDSPVTLVVLELIVAIDIGVVPICVPSK